MIGLTSTSDWAYHTGEQKPALSCILRVAIDSHEAKMPNMAAAVTEIRQEKRKNAFPHCPNNQRINERTNELPTKVKQTKLCFAHACFVV